MFSKKLHFENKKVRTADVNPFFLKIASINEASRGKKKGTNLKKIDLSRSVNSIDLFSNQMLEFLAEFVEKMP